MKKYITQMIEILCKGIITDTITTLQVFKKVEKILNIRVLGKDTEDMKKTPI